MRLPRHPATIFPVFVTIWLVASTAFSQPAPEVESFSPRGEVKRVRQVQVRFSDAMTPFGDPRETVEPFEIDCSEPGTARWVDTNNWVYDFGRDLPAGVRCEFRLREGLSTLEGEPLAGPRVFRFSTGGPAILQSRPWEGSRGIDENQVFILELDAPAVQDTVLQHAFFEVQGNAQRIGVRIVGGEPRREVLDSTYPYRERDEETDARLLLVGARLTFPQDAQVTLHWGSGIETSSGVATSEAQRVTFETRPDFHARFHCTRENADRPCVALTPMRVHLSAPIAWEDARGFRLRGPDGFERTPEEGDDPPEWTEVVSFQGPFPADTTFELSLPDGLEDDAGRRLLNRAEFPLTVRTGELPPLAKFADRFGVLESRAGGILPVTVRNLEADLEFAGLKLEQPSLPGQVLSVPTADVREVLGWLAKVRSRGWDDRKQSIFAPPPAKTPEEAEAEALVEPESPAAVPVPSGEGRVRRFTLPKPNGPQAFEVMGIPLEQPGFYVVELESRILGEALLGIPAPMYVPTTALVTDLAVHFKWGVENSLVWVTRLETGEPAAGVAVQVWDCSGQLRAEATTSDDGLAWLQQLPSPSDAPYCSWNDYSNGLLVTARSEDDFSFVHSNWDDGIEPWRFQLPQHYGTDLVSAHTVFDRPLFRPAETVHMKHVLRRRSGTGFSLPEARELPVKVKISHTGSDQRFEIPVRFDESGLAESTWPIPAEARLGTYSVGLVRENAEEWDDGWYAGSFRVEEFRVPLMRGHVRWPDGKLVQPEQVTVDVTVEYLAGGTAGLLPIAFRHRVRPGASPSFADYEGFQFADEKAEEGIFRGGEGVEASAASLHRQELQLDEHGSARIVIEELPTLEGPARLEAELEFRDPNGEVQTVSSSTELWSSQWLAGVKLDGWAVSREELAFQVAVVDLSGGGVAGAEVVVDAFERVTHSHRKRLVGGFYSYEHSVEVRRLATVCRGETGSGGILECSGQAPRSGNLILQARVEDPQGRPAYAQRSIWVAGDEDWWFEVSDDDRMDLIPEAKRYEPGQEGVFQARMPFREATALVTVEREGILRAYVRRLEGREPVIRVPMEAHDAPNVFVSALAVRGRVGDVQPTALVDLGKPAYRLGIAQVQVGWKAHELEVQVAADREVYRVRDVALVDVQVQRAWGGALPADAEIAVAAVDEGLLELLPNSSWDLLSGMMSPRGYAVQTSTLQMQVVGKRHFGLKALPQGGGGGKSATRDLFDTLLLWKGRVPLDEQGRARIEVPLNDSLTSFRIVAVATAGDDLFGSGTTTIRSTQDLMLFAGIPPLVRSGDQFEASFTVRNASERDLQMQLTAVVQPAGEELETRRIALAAGRSTIESWKIVVPAGVDELRYRVGVAAGDGTRDSLEVGQRVVPAVPVRTLQATLAQLTPKFSTPVQLPSDALPDRGGLRLGLNPSLLAGLDSVRDYMRRYPYGCLEQVVSKAVALGDRRHWEQIARVLPAYLDSDGLAKYFPSLDYGSEVLTAYLLSVSHQRGWDLPESARFQMLDGLEGFVEGRITRYSALPATDRALRKMSALEALSRYREVLPGQLDSIAVQPNLWPTSGVIDWMLVLHRNAELPSRSERLAEAAQVLRARLNLQGTTMGFSTEGRDRLWWLMVSPDLNAVRLVLAALETGGWSEDLPRLMVGALDRRRRGHWDLTTANAWGVLAAEAFAKRFESARVEGVTWAGLNRELQSLEWGGQGEGGSIDFQWPPRRSVLHVRHEGAGAPWLSLESRAALPLSEELSSGYRVTRTVTPVRQARAGTWSAGDVARVRLEIEAQADMTWVVLQDPIPAGAAILGSGLGRDSAMLTVGEEDRGARPSFEERSFEAYRAYYEYFPKGSRTVEYTVRLNNAGRFQLPPTRVEALYHPESFGETPNPEWVVAP